MKDASVELADIAVVTADAAELNILDGVTATAAEINKLAGVTGGTSTASKAAVLGANKNLDILALPVSGLKVGAGAGTAVDSTAAELNTLNGVTGGVVTASKAVVVDANKDIAAFRDATVRKILGIAGSALELIAAAAAAAHGMAAKLTGAAGANNASGNGFNGGGVDITAGAGGNSSGADGNGGVGGSVTITLGVHGTKNGSGTDGADGNLIVLNLPAANPMVLGALYSDAGTIKVSAG